MTTIKMEKRSLYSSKKGLLAAVLMAICFFSNACSDDDDGAAGRENGTIGQNDFSGPQGGFLLETANDEYSGSIATFTYEGFSSQGYDPQNDVAAIINMTGDFMQDDDDLNVSATITITHKGVNQLQETAYGVYTLADQAAASELLTGALVNFSVGGTVYTAVSEGGSVVLHNISQGEIEGEVREVALEFEQQSITLNGAFRAVEE